MANADLSTSAPEPQRYKRPPDTVVPPPPTPPVDVESHNDSASDGHEERREEDCQVARSELENKIPMHCGSDILSEGKAVFGEVTSCGKDILGEEPIVDSHIIKLEIVKEEKDLPAVKLDTSTPEQPMGECQAVKLGSERKRKSHDGSKNIESLFERADRRLTRSNSRIITKGRNNCQKVAKRLTRSQNPSPADYLGNDVDILGLERALKRLSRTGSKRVLQEPTGDDGPPNSPPEKTSDCVMLDLPDSDGLSDVVNRGVTIIEESMETIQEDEIQELVNLDCPSDEMESDNGSTEADETIGVTKETNAVCAEESILLLEFIKDESMPENKDVEQTTVLPNEVCSTAGELSSDENRLESSRLEMPSKRVTRSALRKTQVELTGFSGFVSSMHETKDAEQSIVLPMEVCSRAVEVSSDENKLDSSRLVTPLKRFTRSALKNEQLDSTGLLDLGSSMDELKNENMEEQETVVAEELNPISVDKSTDGVKIEKHVLDVPSKRLTRSALKNAQMDVTPFLGFRSTIDEQSSETQDGKKMVITQVSTDGSSYSKTIKLESSEFETPLKRITRSAVKNAQMASSELELPPRRFTRSLLKSNVSYDEEDGAGDSGEVSELERATRKVSCSSQRGNKVDSRPMMSGGCKKFDLIKPPSNARELLATGFLEGLDVMYIVPHSKVS